MWSRRPASARSSCELLSPPGQQHLSLLLLLLLVVVGRRAVYSSDTQLQHNHLGYMMKFKPNQTRTYDGEGFKRRAACLCFKSDREDEVLLVSSSRHPDQWIVPGGGMEPEEEPDGAAIREVYEEAGVKGKLGRLLGVFEHNQDRKHRTYVYVLIVTETVDDWEDSITIGRKRRWFKIKDALQVLQNHKPVHAEYLLRLTTATCSAPCSPSCVHTNDNSPVSAMTDNNGPHYGCCSTQGSGLVNR